MSQGAELTGISEDLRLLYERSRKKFIAALHGAVVTARAKQSNIILLIIPVHSAVYFRPAETIYAGCISIFGGAKRADVPNVRLRGRKKETCEASAGCFETLPFPSFLGSNVF